MQMHKRLGGLALLLAGAAVLTGAASATAQTGGEASFEKNLDDGLRQVIDRGADIFNKQGDYSGCYRLYQGALMTVRPLLTKYPDLQKAIDQGMADASLLPSVHDRAHALRKTLDEVRFTITPGLRPTKTLWDRLGGEPGVSKVIAELVKAAATDPKVNFDRGGKYKFTDAQIRQLQKALVDFVSQATGGPYKYKGPAMKPVHRGMGITDDEFDALAGHLKNVLEKNGIKADDVKAVLDAVGSTRTDIVEPPEKKIEKIEKIEKKDDKNPPADPKLAQITGKLTLQGKPLNYGFVTFVDGDGRKYSANVLDDGTYHLRKGMPPGEYTVVIEDTPTPPQPGEQRTPIPAKYQGAGTSGLRYNAPKGASTFDINLQ